MNKSAPKLICPPASTPFQSANFDLVEDLTLNQSIKNTLKEAITKSTEPHIWDRAALQVIKTNFPQASIMLEPGTVSSFKELNSYEVKILISEGSLNRGTVCQVNVNYKIDQKGDTKKVIFKE